jgi:ubiquinone biosynthesis protein COQ9
MSDSDFDTALITAFFRTVGEDGWRRTTVAAAAHAAGLSLAEARARFPGRAAVLLRFGRLADQAALTGAMADGSVRDRLFDLLMRRFDALQAHRAGVLGLLRALPRDPPTALLLSCATNRSMRWMLQAAGVPATGLRGRVQVRGLVAIWLWVLRAWERDDTTDLSRTMAALDSALARGEQAAVWLCGAGRRAPREQTEAPEQAGGSVPQSEPPSDPPAD